MRLGTYLLIIAVTIGCQSSKLPSKRYSQYQYHTSYTLDKNELKVELGNPLNCPLRVWIQSSDKDLKSYLDKINPIELEPTSDTLLIIPNINKLDSKINFASRLGSLSKKIKDIDLELPFIAGKQYRVIQGNNSNYTHNTNWSRYAIDFSLKINDTVCSATDGYVVGVIDQYKYGGKGDEWKPFGNFITIYDPFSGIFTQYVHLTENGSFVKVGDSIKKGQPIGLSGLTGQTDIEHLHFNCLVPSNSNDGLQSIPYQFIEGYKSVELKRNGLVKK